MLFLLWWSLFLVFFFGHPRDFLLTSGDKVRNFFLSSSIAIHSIWQNKSSRVFPVQLHQVWVTATIFFKEQIPTALLPIKITLITSFVVGQPKTVLGWNTDKMIAATLHTCNDMGVEMIPFADFLVSSSYQVLILHHTTLQVRKEEIVLHCSL